jgi:iron-sulfur cluster repair protein YtfE (RIC family)
MLEDLEQRTGLPEYLLVLRAKYPREMWQGHTNFNELTAFWLERHGMFRQVLDRLVAESCEFLDGRAPRYGVEMSRFTGFLLNQLHGHHGIEDAHYFPMFRKLDARLQRGFDLLDGDHHALHDHMAQLAQQSNAVLEAMRAEQHVLTHDRAGQLLEVQQSFQTFLTRHLEDEEDLVVPLVLEYGADMS